MSYFDDSSIAQIQQVLARISGNVSLCAVVEQNGELSEKIREFLNEFSGVTDTVPIQIFEKGDNPEVEEKLGVSIFPVIALMRDDGSFSGVSFHGLPVGHELESFVLALYNVGGPGQPISESLLTRVKSLDGSNLKVGVNLSCTMCPELVQACHRIAAINENVSAAMLDLQHFPQLRKQYRVMSVPVIIINDEKTVFGKKSIEELLELLT
jgi:thioredoxin reductase (NADPH)